MSVISANPFDRETHCESTATSRTVSTSGLDVSGSSRTNLAPIPSGRHSASEVVLNFCGQSIKTDIKTVI